MFVSATSVLKRMHGSGSVWRAKKEKLMCDGEDRDRKKGGKLSRFLKAVVTRTDRNFFKRTE